VVTSSGVTMWQGGAFVGGGSGGGGGAAGFRGGTAVTYCNQAAVRFAVASGSFPAILAAVWPRIGAPSPKERGRLHSRGD